MQITKLKIKNWRNFTIAELDLQRRAFIIGPNAAGKSNLLDVLKFLRDLVIPGGGLQAAVNLRGGVPELRSFAARARSNVTIEFSLGDDSDPTKWTYELEFNAAKNDSTAIVEREVVRKAGQSKPVLNRPDAADASDPERLTQTALEQVNANKHFREIAEFLETIRYLHVVPQIIRDPARSVGKDDPFGGDLIERINATPKKTRDARLRRMEEALKIAVPQMDGLELEVDRKGVPHLRAKYRHWRPHGAWQREDRFSDGTLRLLGLIWSLQESGGPLLLEEPEQSLNPAVVQQLAPLIARSARRSKRQVLITTHSSDLLSENVRLPEVHLLQTGENGTIVKSEPDLAEVRRLLEGGMPLGEALLPMVRATNVDQLSLLDLLAS